MKKLFVLVFAAFFMTNIAQAQEFKWGLRVGGSTTSLEGQNIEVGTSIVDTFRLAIQDAKFGIHFGAFARIELGPMYIQPEFLYNSAKVTYTKEDFTSTNVIPELFEDTYNHLDIPVLIGAKFSAFRIQGGVIGSILLNETTNLTEIATFERARENMTFGWQAGIGFDISRILIDVKYEGNFNRFGEGITIQGNEYSFDARRNRFVVSLGFQF